MGSIGSEVEMSSSFSYRMRPRNLFIGATVGGFLLFGSMYAVWQGWNISVYGGELSAELARYLYAVLGALGLFTLAACWKVWSVGERQLTVDARALRVPVSEWSRTMVRIERTAISNLRVDQYNDIHTLVIQHAGGMVKLRSPHFRSFEEFDRFVTEVVAGD
jgi:hypothetical protein